MHGRLKVRTTAEQQAEKEKQRELKRKVYSAEINTVFLKRKEGVYDKEALTKTALLLAANPDALTLWNFRREILLKKKDDHPDTFLSDINVELDMTEACLIKNPKSYSAWHHRRWVLGLLPTPPWEKELLLCNKYLEFDERNFHCWNHRRLVVEGSKRDIQKELDFSLDLIKKNLSNYSAWHYRSKLLPLVHPPVKDSLHPVAEDVLVKELKMVVDAVFTDPSDQSPWFFLRWLINKQMPVMKIIRCGVIRYSKSSLILVIIFNGSISVDELPTISVPIEGWKSLPCLERFSTVWTTVIGELCQDIVITHRTNSFSISPKLDTEDFEFVSFTEHSFNSYSNDTKEMFKEIKNNCLELDEIDPGNKWVLLTLVDVMRALDVVAYLDTLLIYFEKLREIDPLRANYYEDMRSQVIVESALANANSNVLSLNSCKLTTLPLVDQMTFFTCIELKDNSLRTLYPLMKCLNCRKLVLDNNSLKTLDPINNLPLLKYLSLRNCDINSFDIFNNLNTNHTIEMLDISGNDVCSTKEIDKLLGQVFVQLKILNKNY